MVERQLRNTEQYFVITVGMEPLYQKPKNYVRHMVEHFIANLVGAGMHPMSHVHSMEGQRSGGNM